ncbi:MAG: ABC transporter substrate-binding protein, partial [Alphaproteobacteria bacterium]|nr:ABC transporter substrate-binding protein [Alphaproteobacteria bacterium]
MAAGVALLAGAVEAAQQGPPAPVEPPFLAERVATGALPPVAERLPENPSVVRLSKPDRMPGRHGGEITMLMGRAKDVRMMVVYGYARLVGFTAAYDLEPDILAGIEVERGRRFTLTLRRGHRWSDGHPFTAEDFRYWWEDVATHPALSPAGPPRVMIVNGEKPVFEVLDKTHVRFTWSAPNPDFLPALAGALPTYIYRPAHYLKRFHERHADEAALAARARKAGQRNWAALHNRLDNLYKNDNPDLPTLQPWVTRTRPPAHRFEFVRNPYYHRIDENGLQLPYLDRVVFTIAAPSIIPAKAGAGESDLQARGVSFSDYTFLKKGERRGGYRVRLWRTAKGAHLALFPNLNVNDPVWRALFRDVRFRRALSLGVDRHEINQAVYFGLTLERNNTVLPQSPLYEPEYATEWAQFAPGRANTLLDEIGLTKRNEDGIRLLPDGRPMKIVVETAGEDT